MPFCKSRSFYLLLYLLPDLSGGFGDQTQFCFLLSQAEQITFLSRSEPALGAESEAFQRDELSRFLDAALQCLLALKSRLLGGHQSKHNRAVVRDLTQWLEIAGAFVVLFQQETMESRSLEDLRCDWTIASTRVKFALIVSPA